MEQGRLLILPAHASPLQSDLVSNPIINPPHHHVHAWALPPKARELKPSDEGNTCIYIDSFHLSGFSFFLLTIALALHSPSQAPTLLPTLSTSQLYLQSLFIWIYQLGASFQTFGSGYPHSIPTAINSHLFNSLFKNRQDEVLCYFGRLCWPCCHRTSSHDCLRIVGKRSFPGWWKKQLHPLSPKVSWSSRIYD